MSKPNTNATRTATATAPRTRAEMDTAASAAILDAAADAAATPAADAAATPAADAAATPAADAAATPAADAAAGDAAPAAHRYTTVLGDAESARQERARYARVHDSATQAMHRDVNNLFTKYGIVRSNCRRMQDGRAFPELVKAIKADKGVDKASRDWDVAVIGEYIRRTSSEDSALTRAIALHYTRLDIVK